MNFVFKYCHFGKETKIEKDQQITYPGFKWTNFKNSGLASGCQPVITLNMIYDIWIGKNPITFA